MRIRTATFLVSLAVSHLAAQPVSLTGTVRDPSGRPVAGALVRLAGILLQTYSAPDGSFSLSSGALVEISSPTPRRLPHTRISSRSVHVVTDRPSRVLVQSFDLSGRRGRTLARGTVAPGAHAFGLGIADGTVSIYRVAVGSRESYHKALGFAGRPRESVGAAPRGHRLSKASVAVDTLDVSHASFYPVRTPLTSTTGAMDISFETRKAALYSIIRIPFNDTARDLEEDLWISYDSLLADSRCPAEVICVWEGRADVLCTFGVGSRTARLTMRSDRFAVDTVVLGYQVSLRSVEPYPAQGVTPTPDEKAVSVYIKRHLALGETALTSGMDSLKALVNTIIDSSACTGSPRCRMYSVFDGRGCDWRAFFPVPEADQTRIVEAMETYAEYGIHYVDRLLERGAPIAVCDIMPAPDSVVCTAGKCVPVYHF